MGRMLSELRDLGPRAYVVGSGPTDFNYQALVAIKDPVFFVNRSHIVSKFCRSPHQYFVTHHICEYPRVDPVTIYIRKMRFDEGSDYHGIMHANCLPQGDYINVECQADDEVLTEEFFQRHTWARDRDAMSVNNMLVAGFGSATTAIHAAWFAGCQDLIMIGCNPDIPGGRYDRRLSGFEMLYQPDKVKENNRRLPGLLGMSVIYL